MCSWCANICLKFALEKKNQLEKYQIFESGSWTTIVGSYNGLAPTAPMYIYDISCVMFPQIPKFYAYSCICVKSSAIDIELNNGIYVEIYTHRCKTDEPKNAMKIFTHVTYSMLPRPFQKKSSSCLNRNSQALNHPELWDW